MNCLYHKKYKYRASEVRMDQTNTSKAIQCSLHLSPFISLVLICYFEFVIKVQLGNFV